MLRLGLEPVGAEPTAEALDRAHYAGLAALDAGFLVTGALNWRQYDAAVARIVGVPEDRIVEAVAGLEAAWRQGRGWHRQVPGALEGLRQLADTGVPLGLVSNADGTVADQLMTEQVCQVGAGEGVAVSVVIDSTVVGVEKPDPRIFALALDALGIPADLRSSVVHVGDSLFADVRGARAAGLRPLHLDPYGDCPGPAGDHEHVRSLAEVAQLVQAARSAGSAGSSGSSRVGPVTVHRAASLGQGSTRTSRLMDDVPPLAGQYDHGVRRPPVLHDHHEPPPAAHRRLVRGARDGAGPQRGGGQPGLQPRPRDERARCERLRHRQPGGGIADPPPPDVPRRHHLRRDPRPGQAGIGVQG